MAAQKFEKGSEEWQMFMEFWQMCQTYYIPEETDEYWDGVMESGNNFLKKYKTPFANGLFWAFFNEMERKMKDGESPDKRAERDD